MVHDEIAAAVLDRVPPIEDLLEEVRGKNHVRVVKYEAVRGEVGIRHRKVFDELFDTSTVTAHALVLHDSLRELAGKKPVFVKEFFRRLGGDWVGAYANLRTTVGADYTANALGSSTQPTQADYIALSNNTAATASGDTSASIPWSSAQSADAAASGTTGEWTALGLSRKQATYAHTNGTASYTQSATWTASSTATATQKAGMFGGSSRTAQSNSANNILFLENTFTATTLNTNDQLSLTWTVNV